MNKTLWVVYLLTQRKWYETRAKESIKMWTPNWKKSYTHVFTAKHKAYYLIVTRDTDTSLFKRIYQAVSLIKLLQCQRLLFWRHRRKSRL